MAKAKSPIEWTYDVRPEFAMRQSGVADYKQKTGRSIGEWIKLVESEGPPTEKERREWLQSKHGLGRNYAWRVAARSVGKVDDSNPEVYLKTAASYVEKMFSGPKANLRPMYDALLTFGKKLGKDVRVCPCQTMVPLYRNHVFAQIKPTTQTRIDLGLSLKDTKVPKRLIDTGGFAKKDRITRRIEITSVTDIDDEVKCWMKVAYDMDARETAIAKLSSQNPVD